MISWKKFQVACFTSLRIIDFVAFSSRFLIELVCCIEFGLISNACCLLKNLVFWNKDNLTEN